MPGVSFSEAVTIHGSLLLNGSMSGPVFTGAAGNNSVAGIYVSGIGLPNPGPNSFVSADISCSNWWCGGVVDNVAVTSALPGVIPVEIHTRLNQQGRNGAQLRRQPARLADSQRL